jgi:hypothetical protein
MSVSLSITEIGGGSSSASRSETSHTGDSRYDRYQIIVAQLARYDRAVEKEFSLVSDRMTWMVLAEAFIFTAFTIAAAAGVKDLLAGRVLVVAILIAMPLLGCFLAAVIIPAIAAAHGAVRRLKKARQALEHELPENLRVDHISAECSEHSLGNIPPRWVPLFILGIWTVLLVVLAVALASALR